MIGGGHESKGLYYLGACSFISCLAFSSPKLIHEHLGDPFLSKLKKMVLEHDSLQTLECKSCQLKKHDRSFFLNILNLYVTLFFYHPF